ncbi:hypothetical protein MACH09_10430 [Vibrio sp. MACH09]|uniref:hypothetical protein n=1 Tax=Vibrio sp. MACH09 TaxID=3025122 RepID=UPI002792FB4E|nr:hypothetical protein [Vibrio sp. MACH09]GLO60535.1 hypothetical protein MACH09_10430 [Vibrio sp. MACH09]
MAYKLSLYLDELSISKIGGSDELIEYILLFIRSFKILNTLNTTTNVLRSSQYQDSYTYSKIPLLQALSESIPSDLRLRFKKIIFDKKNSIWDSNRVHSSEDYYEFFEECVTDGSLAEAGERKLNGEKGVMIFLYPFENFDNEIKVTKEETTDIYITRLSLYIDMNNWLENEFDIREFNYDCESNMPPTDRQTYLRESTRYIKTEKINQGRVVYQCALTRRYHSVDNLHSGLKSHVEVWDKHGVYLGESDLIGELNVDLPKDKKRRKDNPPWL